MNQEAIRIQALMCMVRSPTAKADIFTILTNQSKLFAVFIFFHNIFCTACNNPIIPVLFDLRSQLLSFWSILPLGKVLTLSKISLCFYVFALQVFLKHCGKRRNCSLRAISPFPLTFSTISDNFHNFHQIQNCRLQTLSV